MGHANYIHLIMKTIEERAKIASEGYDDDGYSAGLYMGYVEGATEQKVIDIDKACEWLKINWRKYVYRDRDDGILFGHWESDFRKVMKE